MARTAPSAQDILDWYEMRVAPLVEKHIPDKDGEWREEARRLRLLQSQIDEELAVCFLGRSGVGKSTLINALVAGDRQLLPTTGVGPLTAQALIVRYGETPSLEVEYHTKVQLGRILLPLEAAHKRAVGATTARADEDVVSSFTPEQLEEIDRLPTEGAEVGSKLDELRKQAKQLITGSQHTQVEIEYLLDGLRDALGRSRAWGTTPRRDNGDTERVQQVREALATGGEGRPVRWQGKAGDPEFEQRLTDHAAGFLAPLIRQLTVTWPSPLLQKGVSLVDLPGLGAMGDSFKAVTRDWIPRAQAIVLVVDRAGIDQASADLLYRSEFLKRLVHSSSCPEEDPVRLLAAVVQIDNVAEERYGKERQRRKWEHFADVQKEMKGLLSTQLAGELQKVWLGGEGDRSRAEMAVSSHLVEALKVFPVSAVQYRKYLADDEDDRAFIREGPQSGVPTLQEHLQRLTGEQREARKGRFEALRDSFAKRVTASLELFRPPTSLARSVTTARLRNELLSYLADRGKEFNRREGALRQLWGSEVYTLIEAAVEKAGGAAADRMKRHLASFAQKSFSVKTLQAAVRHGGRFQGSNRLIDLPQDLALGFDAEIASVWDDPILRRLRQATKDFASDCSTFIENAISWAKEHELSPMISPLEVLLRAVQAGAELTQDIGEEQTKRLRNHVRDNLVRKIEGPIAKRCRAFGDSGLNEGAGVKARVLQLFDDLTREVVAISKKTAIELLRLCVEHAHESVQAAWEGRSPVRAAEEVVKAHLADQVGPTEEDRARLAIWREIEPVLTALNQAKQPSAAKVKL